MSDTHFEENFNEHNTVESNIKETNTDQINEPETVEPEDQPTNPTNTESSNTESSNTESPKQHFEVVFYTKFGLLNGPSRPTPEQLTDYFNKYGEVHHVKCPDDRQIAFVFMTSLNTNATQYRVRVTKEQIIKDMTPETKFYINVANSRRPQQGGFTDTRQRSDSQPRNYHQQSRYNNQQQQYYRTDRPQQYHQPRQYHQEPHQYYQQRTHDNYRQKNFNPERSQYNEVVVQEPEQPHRQYHPRVRQFNDRPPKIYRGEDFQRRPNQPRLGSYFPQNARGWNDETYSV